MNRKLVVPFLALALFSSSQWGINLPGVKTLLATDKKIIALSFDACGNEKGPGYDKKLINFLTKENIPATLFISGIWIDQHREIFDFLAGQPGFEIENHGLKHRPASTRGFSAYGIKGTKDEKELVEEIKLNGDKIKERTGRQPKYYRSATAHYDETAVKIARQLGYEPVGFDINGDLGATASQKQIVKNLLKAKPGSIILMHMNHPEGETAEGLIQAIPELKKKGFTFVRLND